MKSSEDKRIHSTFFKSYIGVRFVIALIGILLLSVGMIAQYKADRPKVSNYQSGSNWKQYASKELGIKFAYPEGWNINEYNEKDGYAWKDGVKELQIGIRQSDISLMHILYYPSQSSIDQYAKQRKAELIQSNNKIYKESKGLFGTQNLKIEERVDTLFRQRVWVLEVINSNIPGTQRYIFTSHNNSIYEFRQFDSQQDDLKITDEVLKTLTFIK